jgi:phospholipase A1
MSFKYQIFQPKNYGVYLGLSQQMWWMAYDNDNSSPVKEMNFNPELFWRKDLNFYTFKFIQIFPEEHKSNGRATSPEDRTMDSYGFGFGNEFDVKIGLVQTQARWAYIHNLLPNNADIRDYMGGGEYRVAFKPKFLEDTFFDKKEFSARLIIGRDFNIQRSGREFGIKFRTVTPIFAPYWYVQIWDGYAESLLDYKTYNTAVRFGLIFQ